MGEVPFTIAHAAVAPVLSRLSSRRLAVSAVAIGAISPDLEYLFFLETRRTIGHTVGGLVVFCLPVSLVLVLLWHRVVKEPFSELLPDRWGHLRPALCQPFEFGSWRSRALAATAVLLGAASHVASDSFTHAWSAGVAAVPALREPVPFVNMPGYAALQYTASAVGMAVLAVAVVVWARGQPRVPTPRPPCRHRVVAGTTLVVLALAAGIANVVRTMGLGGSGPRTLAVAGLLGVMTGGGASVVVYAVARSCWPAGTT